jgi:hypothetical protein
MRWFDVGALGLLLVVTLPAVAAPVSSTVAGDPELTIQNVTANDPESAPQTGTIDPISINSSASRTSASEGTGYAYQNVSLSFTDAYHGAFVYSDGYSGVQGLGPYAYDNSIYFGPVLFPTTSSYSFTLTTPGAIEIDWVATFSQNLTIFPLIFIVDGSTYRYYANGLYFVYAGYPSPGSWSEPLAAGDHVLQVADFSNLSGGWPDVDTFETTTLSFAITGTIQDAPTPGNSVPEPGTGLLMAFGMAGLYAGRRRIA